MEAKLTIGRLAESAQVNVETVRHYRPVQRKQNGYRSYSPAGMYTLRFIKRARGLGFSVDEVRTTS